MKRLLLRPFVSAETKILVEKLKEEMQSQGDTFPYTNLAAKGKFSWVDRTYLNSYAVELEIIRTKTKIMRQVLGTETVYKPKSNFVTLQTTPWNPNQNTTWTDPRIVMGGE